MPVLVDTNVWIGMFRHGNPLLEDLLEDNEVVCHPLVIGELSMGSLPQRSSTLRDLKALARLRSASWDEVHHFVESQTLYSRGLQWNDASLLAAAILANTPLWTLDKRLHQVAEELGTAWHG